MGKKERLRKLNIGVNYDNLILKEFPYKILLYEILSRSSNITGMQNSSFWKVREKTMFNNKK